MQELKVYSWCNACFDDGGARVEAVETYRITIEPEKGKSVAALRMDFCEVHAKAVRDLMNLAQRTGSPLDASEPKVRKPAPKAAPKAAPKVGPLDTLATPPTLFDGRLTGARSQHPCPVCASSYTFSHVLYKHLRDVHRAKAVVQPKVCPDCGHRLKTMQHMVAHRASNHGYSYIDAIVGTIPKGRGGDG